MRDVDHEKLDVYRAAIAFVAWSSDLLTNVPKSVAVHNRLDAGRIDSVKLTEA